MVLVPSGTSVRHATGSVAIIGSAGFTGRRLAAALTAGGVRTACFTRQERFVRDGELSAAVATADTVFYLATSINPALGETNPELTRYDHLVFTDLLDRLRRTPDPPTVVLTSSGGTVYDPDFPPPFDEGCPVRPTGAYGRAKLAMEEELLRYCGGRPGVILRLSNIYGPGQPCGRGQGVLANWLDAVLHGRPLQVIGDPECSRDYVYVDDVVDAMSRLLDHRVSAPLVLNIGSATRTPLHRLLDVVTEVVSGSVDGRLVLDHRPGRRFDRRDTWLDVRLAERLLGWRPATSLRDGVAATWSAVLAAAGATATDLSPTVLERT